MGVLRGSIAAQEVWSDERTAELERLFADPRGFSSSEIASRLGRVSRNAVVGKLHRLGLKRGFSRATAGGEGGHKQKGAKSTGAKSTGAKSTATNAPPDQPCAPTAAVVPVPPPAPARLEPPGAPLALLDLEDRRCRYPVADDRRGVPTLFCGEPYPADGRAFWFCDACAEVALTVPVRLTARKAA